MLRCDDCRMKKSAIAIVLGVALVGLTGCAGGGTVDPVGTWGTADTRGEAHLEFTADGDVFGSDRCNNITGSWTANGSVIEFGVLASTMMACPDVEAWSGAPATATISGDKLTLLDEAGATIDTLQRAG